MKLAIELHGYTVGHSTGNRLRSLRSLRDSTEWLYVDSRLLPLGYPRCNAWRVVVESITDCKCQDCTSAQQHARDAAESGPNLPTTALTRLTPGSATQKPKTP